MANRISLSLILLTTCALAQDPSFKAGVSLVEIDAEVISNGRVIEGLDAAAFQIKDNGKPVSVRYCVWEQTPLDIVFLFDLSKTMALKLEKLQIAAEIAMAELRDGDRVSIASFDESFRVELPLSSDLKEIKRRTRIGLAEARFGNSFPPVLNAAIEAAAYLSGQAGPNKRRAILMFTADVGSGKKESHIAAAKNFWGGDALLSAMVFPHSLTRFTHEDNPLHFGDVQKLGFIMKFSPQDSIDELAALTGGEIVYAENTGNAAGSVHPNAALREVMRRMRQRYKLYYDRPTVKPGLVRRVDVGLSESAAALYPNARIIARKGYLMPRDGSSP